MDVRQMSASERDQDTGPDAIVVLGLFVSVRHPRLLPAARERGLVVLGVDEDSPAGRAYDEARRAAPSHPLADTAELVWLEGGDRAAVLDAVADWSTRYRIRGVLVFGESFVETGAVLTDHLGLPGVGLRAGRVCRNKLLQRRYLAPWSPRSVLVDHPAAARGWTSFPCVLKPLDGQASAGVRRVGSAAELTECLAAHGFDTPLLVEELAVGHEVSVESLVQAGEVRFAEVTGKLTNEDGGSFFVELGHTVPDAELTGTERAAVLAANAAVLARLSFRDGVAHAEFRVGPDGTVRLMEIAARPAGDSIITLYQLATGAPMEDAMVAIALGEPFTYPAATRWARQKYVEHQPGVVAGVTADGVGTPVTWLRERWAFPEVAASADGTAGVRMIVMGRARGDRLNEIRSSADRSAMYVIDAPDPRELAALTATCDAAIRVDLEGTPDV
jgi:biotin carboxylase